MMKLILVAAVYGTLIGGDLVKAPYAVKTDAGTTETASLAEPVANALGYKLVEDVRPSCSSNEYAVAVGWTEREVEKIGGDGRWRIFRLYEKRVVVPPPRKFSKLKIYGAIIALPDANGTSAWERVKAWLEAKEIDGVNGWMAFQLAQEISEDHPLFAPLAEEARQLLGLAPAQFDALLSACILEE